MASYNITGRVNLEPLKKATKAFNKFDKQTQAWSKHTKKAYAAATAAASYYAQRVLRDSVKNALEDEKSQRVLALTLANVANATDATVIATEQQISAMQAAYGVTDDLLRPALARLARSSGSASQAVYDLKLALDISAATGKSLEAVTGALGKAMDGNYASLQRLGLGLDASVLKTKDQNKIFGQLRKTFASFAANEAATTEGKFRRIAVAADEAKEIIGVALIDSINGIVNTQGGVEGLTKAFNDLAYAIGDTIRGLTIVLNNINDLSKKIRLDLVAAIPVLGGWLRGFQAVGKQQRVNLALQKSITGQVISARNAEVVALKARKDANNEVQDGQKKTLEQLMAEEAARKAGFKITEDIDSIQVVAAARRLEEARQYKAQVLDAAQAQFEAVKNNVTLLDAVWQSQLTAFDVFLAALKTKAAQAQIAVSYQGTGAGSAPTGTTPISAIVPEPATPQFLGGGGSFGTERLALGGNTNVMNVSVNAFGTQDFLNAVQQAQQEFARNGWSTSYAGG